MLLVDLLQGLQSWEVQITSWAHDPRDPNRAEPRAAVSPTVGSQIKPQEQKSN